MDGTAGKRTKALVRRRVLVKSVVFAVWAAGMLALALHDGQELSQNACFFVLFIIVATWAVSTMRDVRRLRRVNLNGQGR